MTNEERDLITQFIERIAAPPPRPAGSVPYTLPAPAQPAVDREADALIADLMLRYPEARYRLTQTAFVQEHALAEAQNTINRLQWELDQARAQQAPAQNASPWGAPAQSRGVFGGLFGGRQSPLPNYAQQQPQNTPPPAPVHAPGYQPGMFQQGGGSSFLGSALTTAAGVAGGMVVGNMLMNAFSGHSGAAHAASTPQNSGWQEASPVSYQDPGQEDSGWTDAGSDEEL